MHNETHVEEPCELLSYNELKGDTLYVMCDVDSWAFNKFYYKPGLTNSPKGLVFAEKRIALVNWPEQSRLDTKMFRLAKPDEYVKLSN